MRYQFNTTYTLEDFWAHNMYWLKYSLEGRRVMTRYRLTILLATAVWLLACYYGFKLTWAFYCAAAFVLVVGGVWQLLAKTFTSSRIRRNLRRKMKYMGTVQSETTFYDDRFCDIKGGVKTETAYENILQVVLYKRNYFYLTADKITFILPCRSLFGQVTVEEFTAFLQGHGITVETVE